MQRFLSRFYAGSFLLTFWAFLLLSSLRVEAQATAVVSEPTEAALDAALVQVATGGTITFACDGTIPITTAKRFTTGPILTPVTLDATGHNITLDGGGKTGLISAVGIYSLNYLTLKHLTLANGAADYGGAIDLAHFALTATNCIFVNNRAT